MAEKVTITLETRVVCTKNHVSCELADEVVILSLATGEYYGLNAVAARIWSVLQEPRLVVEIRDILLTEYLDVTAEECTSEVFALLGEMRDIDLITVREA